MTKNVTLLILTSLLVACITAPGKRISSDDLGAIAVCNAGVESSLHTKLTAAIKSSGGEFNAELNETLKGIIVGDAGFNNEQKFAAYNAYVDCLKMRLTKK